MTKSQIEKRAAEEMVKFTVAAKIREVLDAARKEFGPQNWDEEDLESQVQALVFEE